MEQLFFLKLHFPPSAGMQTAVEPPHGSLHLHTHARTHASTKMLQLASIIGENARSPVTAAGTSLLRPSCQRSNPADFLLHPANTTNDCRDAPPGACGALSALHPPTTQPRQAGRQATSSAGDRAQPPGSCCCGGNLSHLPHEQGR